ncbi:MAG TPA: LPS assembly protein LptD [Phycisphaerae bacterium]|nr:LPS assembly protein LptD [Phycisphaerae bacterium]HNU45099.1 LPS assembly protein LptD [Phycisphaerae bacterium]
MHVARAIGCHALVLCTAVAAFAQTRAPIADSVELPILPAGISELPLRLGGALAYVSHEDDGALVVQIVGDAVVRLGTTQGLELRSREAVVWISRRDWEQRTFQRVEALLWRDASIREIAGTVTEGPALFVSLASFGEVSLNVDEVAWESARESPVYEQGQAIRQALLRQLPRRPDEEVALRVYDASGLTEAGSTKPRPVIHFKAGGDLTVSEQDRRRVATVTGGVYVSRGIPGTGEYLEVRADSAVLFFRPGDDHPPELTSRPVSGAEADQEAVAGGAPRQRLPLGAGEAQLRELGVGDERVESVYLEGDVVMSQGENMIRATRLYYDFLHDRALIVDAIVRTSVTDRKLPLYLRAAEIRQLSAQEYAASQAVLTTSEFHTPHYHVGAGRVELVDRTVAEPTGQRTGIRAGRFRIWDSTFNVNGVPLMYWPYVYGDVDTSETSIRGVRSGYSEEFGLELETKWDLFNLLGLERPSGFDTTLSLDYFTRRGPAAGIDSKYTQDDYFGLLRSYLLWDDGEDSLGRQREDMTYQGTRGRMLWRHRQYFEDDWEVSLELSYISDRNFLEEFFESEFDLEKEQETLLYVKKQTDHWAVTGLAQWRLLDFYTQTEHMPEVTYRWLGDPLADSVTFFSENRAGIVRLRGADQTFFEWWHYGGQESSDSTARADSRQEAEYPVDLGPVRVTPFLSARGTMWDETRADGGTARAFATYGLRGSMYFWRAFGETNSELFDIHGVRHVIKPDATVWMSHTNYDSHELYPITSGVETIDEIDGGMVGIRQRWQTKRGEGDNYRTVDVLTLDVEAAAFNDGPRRLTPIGYASPTRPEESIAHNHVASSSIWRVNDRTALLSEANYNLDENRMDLFNVSVAVERPPRLAYLVGYRYIGAKDSNLLGLGANYMLTEKHSVAVRELFDLDRGRTAEFTVGLIRKLPRWFAAISFELDDAEDDFGVSLSLWPEGMPSAALGSRRFTGLGETTRMLPD